MLEQFYEDILKKRKPNQEVRLQTNQEFQQNEIKRLNESNYIIMFSTKTRGRKAFAAKQKTWELKTIRLKSKIIEKGSGKRLKLNELIKKATSNLNKTCSAKYDFSPNQVEKKSLENKYFTDIYDFHRLVRVKNHEDRTVRYIEKQDEQKRRKLRKPLDIGDNVLLIAELLKKKDAPGALHKSSTKNKSFFNRNEIFKINKVIGTNNGITNYYWVEKDGKRIKDRFFRQKDSLNKKWMFHIFILTS